MKKITLLISIFFLFSIFLISCKTPPVQKSIANINKSVITTSKPSVKFYFPEFAIYNSEKQKDVIAGGDCIIAILPDGKSMIIDSFVPDVQNQLVQFIKDLGITKIDYLIATHFHGDHIGGMPALINNFEIGTFYSNGIPFDTSYSRQLLSLLEEKGIQNNILQQGDQLILSDKNDSQSPSIDVLWPVITEELLYDAYYNPGRTQKLRNNTSLTFKFVYGKFSILFTGDIYKQSDRAITRKYGKALHSTILKVPHHGEWYTANSPKFVKTVSPDYGIIQDTRYVNGIISSIYKNAGSKILYRNTPGFILVESNGSDYKISEESF